MNAKIVASRMRALVADSLLAAYVLWCVSFVAAHAAGEFGRQGWLEAGGGFVGRRPWLFLLAPFVAVLWQVTGRSIGQVLNRVLVVGDEGRPATLEARAWRGLLAGVQVAVVLFPAALGVLGAQRGGSAGFHLFLSLLLALAFAALSLFDRASRSLPGRLTGTRTDLAPARAMAAQSPWYLRPNPWIVLGVLCLTAVVAVKLTRFEPIDLVAGFDKTKDLWSSLLAPEWAALPKVVEKIVETIFLALFASALALPFAFVLAFVGARNLTQGSTVGRIAYVFARVLMNVTRSIEPIIWVIIFSIWVGVGPDAGMLALFVHSVAALGKLYSEAVEGIDPGPVEAIQATGANGLQVLRYGVVPQVIPPFLSFTIYRWDINVRMATILGFVGGGGIGELLVPAIQLSAWGRVSLIALFITLVVWGMDWASSKSRERLT